MNLFWTSTVERVKSADGDLCWPENSLWSLINFSFSPYNSKQAALWSQQCELFMKELIFWVKSQAIGFLVSNISQKHYIEVVN